MAERALGRRAAARSSSTHAAATEDEAHEARLARTAAKRRLASGGILYYALAGVTQVMTLDVRVFGRVRSGPFFALLERTGGRP
jgi:hypothetical protein